MPDSRAGVLAIRDAVGPSRARLAIVLAGIGLAGCDEPGRNPYYVPTLKEAYGRSVSLGPDIDGDGLADVAVGAPDFSNDGNRFGHVYLYSSGTGRLLQSLSLAAFPDEPGDARADLGVGVRLGPDVDGDGRGDVLVGVGSQPRAYLFSGASGELLHRFVLDSLRGFSYGPDADGDGRGDIVLGSRRSVWLYSGATGTQNYIWTAESCGFGDEGQTGPCFGDHAIGPDATGDGFGDLVLRMAGPTINDVTTIELVNGFSGQIALSLRENVPTFGWGISLGPDADGDGRADLLMGAPSYESTAGRIGRAYLYSGSTGELLWTFDGLYTGTDGRLGTWVQLLSDSDGDGLADAALGEIEEDLYGNPAQHYSHIVSGRTGELYRTYSNIPSIPLWGPDADGDGIPDFVTSDYHSYFEQAHVTLFSGSTGLPIRRWQSELFY